MIFTLQPGIFAAPTYLAKNGATKSIDELTTHNCLSHYHIGNLEWEFKNQEKISVTGNIQSNSGQPLIELAKLGHGVIRTFEIYVKNEVENHILQPILKNFWPDAIDIYIIGTFRFEYSAPSQSFCRFCLSKNKRAEIKFFIISRHFESGLNTSNFVIHKEYSKNKKKKSEASPFSVIERNRNALRSVTGISN